jgi:hypothetical protein
VKISILYSGSKKVMGGMRSLSAAGGNPSLTAEEGVRVEVKISILYSGSKKVMGGMRSLSAAGGNPSLTAV